MSRRLRELHLDKLTVSRNVVWLLIHSRQDEGRGQTPLSHCLCLIRTGSKASVLLSGVSELCSDGLVSSVGQRVAGMGNQETRVEDPNTGLTIISLCCGCLVLSFILNGVVCLFLWVH